MKELIITEKPSVARQFARALGVKGGGTDGYIEDDRYVITWCIGHLIEMAYPEEYDEKYAKWDIEDLPFLPKKFKYIVKEDTKKQFGIVKRLLNRKDVGIIYNAGDSGREGEYIQRLVYNAAGVEKKKDIRRVWIDSQTDAEIIKGLKEAKPESEYDDLSNAAYQRAIEDYLVGINLSRAFSCKYGYSFYKSTDSGSRIIAVGRVMTCVLSMIVEREREVEAFRPTKFYKVDAAHDGFMSHWKAVKGSRFEGTPSLYNDTGFKDKKTAEGFVGELREKPFLTVGDTAASEEKKNAPLLYNLAELQNECSRKFRISPDQTLETAQKLYESKLTTYPRTDARVLSSAVADEIKKNISGTGRILPEYAGFTEEILQNGSYKDIKNTRYTNDSKITDHYAIIPTGEGDISGLTDLELDIYKLIARRFLSIFYPAAVYRKTALTLIHEDGERFFASEKLLVSPGYQKVLGKEEDDKDLSSVSVLSKIKKGQVLPADFRLAEAETKPPKRYTSGSIILAMENAGKLIEDREEREILKGNGIGTSATRADTLSKLIARKYISLTKSSQVLKPTAAGCWIYDTVKESVPQMLSPKMTASWELGLSRIAEGKVTPEKYQSLIEDFVDKAVKAVKAKEAEQAPEKEAAGKCPNCGKTVYSYLVESKQKAGLLYHRYGCSGYNPSGRKSCQFGFREYSAGRMLTREDCENLMNGRPTAEYEFAGKKGPFKARIGLKENGLVDFIFAKDETGLVCPVCGEKMQAGSYYYECGNEDCGFSFWKTVSGRTITEEEAGRVFSESICGPMAGFKDMNGKPFEAYIIFDRNSGKKFIIRTVMGGRPISREEALDIVIDIMDEGTSKKYSGFVSAAGKPYEAAFRLKDGHSDGFIEFDFPNTSGRSSFGRKKSGGIKKRKK